MKIILRPPGPGDIGRLIAMHGELYARQFHFDAAFEADITQKMALFLRQTDGFHRLLIAQMDGETAGSIAVSQKAEQTAFINFLLVTPAYRKKGIATMLLEKVIAHARENGCRRVCLETYSCLQSARRLYRQFAFELDQVTPGVEKYGQVFDREFWKKNLQ